MTVTGNDRRPFDGHHRRLALGPGPGALELAQRPCQQEAAAQDRRQRQARVQQEKQPTAREVRAGEGSGWREGEEG